MKNECHILNGDSLKEQFPDSIMGKKIIARLCLVDGNVKAKTLNELFKIRGKFISESYNGYTKQDHLTKNVIELNKIQNISFNTEINLWFEDDLFCQVNFWFVVNLLFEGKKSNNIFLIRPKEKTKYSFGRMSKDELVKAYKNKIKIEPFELKELSKIWKYYQQDDCFGMFKVAKKVDNKYPFLIPAIHAHKDRIPINGNLGRPEQSLIQIMDELKTDNFEKVFGEFCNREGIYGFGDLQVKRIYDGILKNR